jgi:hypothetical protein
LQYEIFSGIRPGAKKKGLHFFKIYVYIGYSVNFRLAVYAGRIKSGAGECDLLWAMMS